MAPIGSMGGGDDTLIGNGVVITCSVVMTTTGSKETIVVLPGDLPYHGDDQLYGKAGCRHPDRLGRDDFLDGGPGNDVLYGDLGDLDAAFHGVDAAWRRRQRHALIGNGGNDQLFGGVGADHYEFSPGMAWTPSSMAMGRTGRYPAFRWRRRYWIRGIHASGRRSFFAKVGQEGFVFRDWDVSEFGGVHTTIGRVQIGSQSTADVVAIANFAPTVGSESSSAQVFEDRQVNISLAQIDFADANGRHAELRILVRRRLPEWLTLDADMLRLTGVPDNGAGRSHYSIPSRLKTVMAAVFA